MHRIGKNVTLSWNKPHPFQNEPSTMFGGRSFISDEFADDAHPKSPLPAARQTLHGPFLRIVCEILPISITVFLWLDLVLLE
jgi:hypothetical protein